MTLVPPFEAKYSDIAVRAIEEVAITARQFPMRVGQAALFGVNEDIPVHLIQGGGILRMIHNQLFEVIEEKGVTIPDQRFRGDSYVPHITDKPGQPELVEGQMITFNNISLIFKSAKLRSIASRYDLKRG